MLFGSWFARAKAFAPWFCWPMRPGEHGGADEAEHARDQGAGGEHGAGPPDPGLARRAQSSGSDAPGTAAGRRTRVGARRLRVRSVARGAARARRRFRMLPDDAAAEDQHERG